MKIENNSHFITEMVDKLITTKVQHVHLLICGENSIDTVIKDMYLDFNNELDEIETLSNVEIKINESIR